MAVRVVRNSLMISDQTEHQAKSVGDGCWVVSYLPGRTLTIDQATAAMKAAEVASAVSDLAGQVGLTALETVGMALQQPPWDCPQTQPCRPRLFGRR
ncbi:hypothetical protein [Nocardia sp. Marseille-Q1738]